LEKAESAFGDKKERRWSFWLLGTGRRRMKTVGTGGEERKDGRKEVGARERKL
jgi:hypothetical protein